MYILVACLVVATCEKSIAATSSKAKVQPQIQVSDVEILGRVFILKKDGNSVKLALINVAAYQESLFQSHVERIQNIDAQRLQDLEAELGEAKARVPPDSWPENLVHLMSEESKAEAPYLAATAAYKDDLPGFFGPIST
jgi:hypothetical protein